MGLFLVEAVGVLTAKGEWVVQSSHFSLVQSLLIGPFCFSRDILPFIRRHRMSLSGAREPCSHAALVS